MRSSISSEGPRLVRIAVPCAPTRVAKEMHSRMNGAKCCAFREAYSLSITNIFQSDNFLLELL